MARAAAMMERLPPLYREGEILAGLVAVLGLQNEILDEETFEVQRAHWFDTCLNVEEAAALADVLDIAPEPWQSLREYRAWVHSLRNARLTEGSVTVGALQLFIEQFTTGYERANRVSLVTNPTPGIVENPARVVSHRIGLTEPLHRFEITNRGLDPAPMLVLLNALGDGGPEYAPMVANLSTGDAVVFRDTIPAGQRLLLIPGETGPLAFLEGRDVSNRLRVEGENPLILDRGENELRFLPLAHFDTPGLDRFLLDMADPSFGQGRWERSAFDRSLFYQDPAVTMSLAWTETTPATVRADVAAEAMRSAPGSLDEALAARDELAMGLDVALIDLTAAGIRSTVRMAAHGDAQPAVDRLKMVLPITHREVGPTGADRLPDAGGLFDVTDFDDSTLR